MNAAISLRHAEIDKTLTALVVAGKRHEERVVLWLAERCNQSRVVDAYEPLQQCRIDQFHIPEEGMSQLMAHLRKNRLSLVAQVHSHPGRAFHSAADDKWAIIRHEGALSIVLPNFGNAISADTFIQAAAVYRLSARDVWEEIPHDLVSQYLQVESS